MADLDAQDYRLDSFPAILKAAWVELQQQPVGMVQLFILKALRGWYVTDSGLGEIQTLIIQIPYLILLILSFFFCGRGKSYRFLALTTSALILYFLGYDHPGTLDPEVYVPRLCVRIFIGTRVGAFSGGKISKNKAMKLGHTSFLGT
jgi:hypothetical protein